ncbi:C2H2 type zinc-finger (2 copies) domain containing protein [Hyaloscypha variabilis]
MPDATNNTATTGGGPSEQELSCAVCLAKFETKEIKREHMRAAWHVYNLKRKIASLPPISIKIFETQVQGTDSGSEDEKWQTHPKPQNHVLRSDQLESQAPEAFASVSPLSSDDEEDFDPAQCLFCDLESTSMQINLTHMSESHSFSIQSVDRLTDVSTFLSYLHILISDFYECLFCHQEGDTEAEVQEHMRAEGHCRLDFDDAENELWEFYDLESEGSGSDEVETRERPVLVDDSLRLPSGKILGHRSQPRSSRHLSRRQRSTSPQQGLLTEAGEGGEAEPPSETPGSQDLRVALRKGTEMSLAGVPELQQRALMVAEKKMEALQARAKNEYQSGVERGANRQKRFRVKHMGKKRGGLEKRLG